MANINLKNFVNINIVAKPTNKIDNIRDTIVVFTNEGSSNTPVLVSNLTQVIDAGFTTNNNVYKYLSIYFNHGGLKAVIIGNTDYEDLTSDMIKALDNKYIIVTYAGDSEDTAAVYSKLSTLAQTMQPSLNPATDATIDDIYGINEKLILARTTSIDDINYRNFVVKYSNVLGAEMTIAAYLSKINVYGINTIYDYAFTNEYIAEENIDDATFTELMDANFNVDIELANEIRNCGGNCKDGKDLVNTYVKIILHQTLTDSLINLLAQKIKGESGIASIYSTLSQELEKYLDSGYLTTDKIWTDETLTVNKKGVNYTLIEKGTPLTKGYLIKVLPLASLTDEEKQNHSAPYVYIIIADQYGIRKITINGEVI